MICCIDVYALLSGKGTGVFLEVLLEQNMLPSPERCLSPTFQTQLSTFLPDEDPYFPAVIKLNQEVLLLALQVGQLALSLRAEMGERLFGDPTQIVPESTFIASRRTRIRTLHHLMQHSQDHWRKQVPDYWTYMNGAEHLPLRVLAWIAHVW
jgi:hypothetical protein